MLCERDEEKLRTFRQWCEKLVMPAHVGTKPSAEETDVGCDESGDGHVSDRSKQYTCSTGRRMENRTILGKPRHGQGMNTNSFNFEF